MMSQPNWARLGPHVTHKLKPCALHGPEASAISKCEENKTRDNPASHPCRSSTMPRASKPASSAPRTPKVPGRATPRKTHACTDCDKAFATSGHLARHQRVHTGEMNHVCPFPGCTTRCARRDNLGQHYRLHFDLRTPEERNPGKRRRKTRVTRVSAPLEISSVKLESGTPPMPPIHLYPTFSRGTSYDSALLSSASSSASETPQLSPYLELGSSLYLEAQSPPYRALHASPLPYLSLQNSPYLQLEALALWQSPAPIDILPHVSAFARAPLDPACHFSRCGLACDGEL
ncbi:hypothetical protein FB451DRAFT_1556890 [Mycena latifolia]|nr:hypothetical protein FB451DRAFT_1556890 [Mycena latifolia]